MQMYYRQQTSLSCSEMQSSQRESGEKPSETLEQQAGESTMVYVRLSAKMETPRSPTNIRFSQRRDLHWREQEKGNPRGARHSKRFNPNLHVKAAGLNWKQVALDKCKWGELEAKYVSQQDIPWSSGKQLSIHNLCPGKQSKATAMRTIHNE